MKNKTAIFIALSLILAVGLGCGMLPSSGSSDNPSSNPSSNSATTDGKTGIPECDEVIDLITRDMQSEDDNYFTKKAREFVIDMVKESVKKNIEENKGDKEKTARECKQIKIDYEKKKAEQQKNSNKSTNS